MPIGDYPIHIFRGGRDGAFFALNPNDGRDTYHWTKNWDCLSEGRGVPATSPEFITGNFYNPIPVFFEWEDTTTSDPFLLFAHGNGSASRILTKYQDGAFSSSSVAQEPFTGGVLYRHDSSDADTPRAYFCNGDANDAVVETAATAPTTEVTAGHDLTCDGMWVVGGDLWITEGYKVAKLTTDADPGLDASYPTKIPVGRPTWPINAVVGLGGSPIVMKPEGVFKFNPAPSVAEFVPIFSTTPHPDNGKGGFTDGRGRVYYPTADGHLIVFTFGFSSQQQPGRITTINRDTPFGRIGAMTADADFVYAAIEPGQVRVQDGLGLQVLDTTDAVAFTDRTTEVTDRKFTTEVDWTGITSADSNDAIYIGADEPFLGVYFELSTDSVRTANAGAQLTLDYSTGTSTWTSAATSADSTLVFSRDGLITVSNTGFQDLLNPTSVTAWEKGTVDGNSKYWFRIKPGAATTGLAKVRAIHIVPYRPAIDASKEPGYAYALQGCHPKILVGKWQGEQITWHDVWTLEETAILAMTVGRASNSHATGQRALHCLVGSGMQILQVGADAHPVRQPWPWLDDYDSDGTVEPDHMIAFSGQDFGKPQNLKRVTGKITVQMPFIQADDEVFFYTWWDEDAELIQRHGPFSGASPMVLTNIQGEGHVLYSHCIFSDATQDAIAPQLHYVGIDAGDWEWDDDTSARPRADIASPLVR